jgi:tagatose-1,6-bisphosphate aldolase
MLKNIPWILLTRGENFHIFKHQLEIATDYGCQGFLAGRALWQELGKYKDEEKIKFLTETVVERFKRISEIVLSI